MKNRIALLLMVSLVSVSCGHTYTPKPMGYVRVHYPEKVYLSFDEGAPYSFEYPAYAKVEEDRSRISEPYWYNIIFPEYKGMIHLSYKELDGNVNEYITDCRTLVYKHSSRSDGIDEIPFYDTINKRYGILYELRGNVASSLQFFLTDSIEHFIRGSLYFNTSPNSDSLRPIIDFIKLDIEHLIETVEWN